MNDVAETPKPVLYSMAFFDVQNLFRHAKDAFQVTPGDGYHHPNFDPKKLHAAVAAELGFTPTLTRFYTGVPPESESEMWSGYWNSRTIALKRSGVVVETRKLRYHIEEDHNGDEIKIAHEKGIDIRIALDLVRCARRKEFDVAIIFSQDQDLSEAVSEIKDIAREQKREVTVYSAYPFNLDARRGINGATWFQIEQSVYDNCIDPTDYRPAKFR